MKLEMSEKLFLEDLFQTSMPLLPEGSGSKLDRMECLTGDASTRRYYRLFMDNGTTFVACLDNPTEDGFNYFVEVQKYFTAKDIRVPIIFDVNLERGYILQEDLGDKTLLQYLAELGSVKEEFNIYKSHNYVILLEVLVHRLLMEIKIH